MSPEDKSVYSAVVLPAKLSVPRSRVWVNRERLFTRLDEMRRHPLVWISAPAGSGKTILTASYLHYRGGTLLWYNLDAGDSDPASFIYYLRLGTKSLLPESEFSLPSLTPEHRPALDLFAAGFFRELYRAFPGGLALVLDNIQDVEPADDFLLLLKGAVREAPEGVRLFGLSRAEPPAPLSRLMVNGKIGALRGDELKWTISEAGELAPLVSSQKISPETLAAVAEKTEGWVAGLVLLLQNLGDRSLSAGAAELAGNQTLLFNYFAGEILAGLADRERDFLLRTAFLPTVSTAVAAALTGEEEAGLLLEELVGRNYFTVKLQAERDTYRYHPLFQDFLRHQARRMIPAADLEDLQRRAATLLQESGDGEAAVPMLIEVKDWPALAALLAEIGPHLIATGRHLILQEWLAGVPREVLNDLPWLLYWQALALMPVDFATSHQLFAGAFEHFLAGGEAIGSALAWAGAVETIVHSLSHTERLDLWHDRLDLLQQRFALDNNPELRFSMAPQVVSIYALRGRMGQEAEKWLATTREILDLPVDATQRIMASFALVALFHWSGQPARSAPILQQQELILAEGAVTPLATIITKLCKAWFSWIYGRFDDCRQAIRDGLVIVDRTGVQHWTFILVVQGITNALVQNKLPEAEQFLERLQPLYHYARDMDRAYHHNEMGWLELLKGRPEHALHQQQIAVELAESVAAPFVIAETCFGLSQAYHALGQFELAEEYLARTRKEGELYGGSQTLAFQCGMVEAFYRLEAGDEKATAVVLARTFVQAKVRGHSAFAWWRQEVIGRLCLFALEHEIESGFTRNLIRQFAVAPPAEAVGSEKWPWPVRIRTLGTFAVIVEDRPLTFDRKAQKKPLELLKAIVALGGLEVPTAKLEEILWPEADGDLAQQNLKAAVHRLRKLVGPQTVLLSDGRVSLARDSCCLDLWNFEATLARLEQVSSHFESVPRACARMKELYAGDFLAGENAAPWLIAPRERLRARFLAALEQLGSAMLAEGMADKARECYEHGLTIDPLVEQFYRGLMRCYWHLDRPAEVQTTLTRCRQLLRTSLGLQCSAATEALAVNPALSAPAGKKKF